MNSIVASIWIKIGKGTNATLIGGIYREQTVIYENAPVNSDHISLQKSRWNNFIRQWKHAATSRSCWVIGDNQSGFSKMEPP